MSTRTMAGKTKRGIPSIVSYLALHFHRVHRQQVIDILAAHERERRAAIAMKGAP